LRHTVYTACGKISQRSSATRVSLGRQENVFRDFRK
jgi:hypothetical protein